MPTRCPNHPRRSRLAPRRVGPRARGAAAVLACLLLVVPALGAQDGTAGEGPRPEPPAPAAPGPTPSPAEREARIRARIQALGSRYFDDREAARRELVLLGAAAQPFVRAALRSADWRIRAGASQVAGETRDRVALPVLVELLADAVPDVVGAATEALAGFGAEADAALAGTRAAHPELAEAIEAAQPHLLRGRVERELIAHITSQGCYGFYEAQHARLAALAPGCVPVLLQILVDPDFPFVTAEAERWRPAVRWLALDALGELGDRSVVAELRGLATNESSLVEAGLAGTFEITDNLAFTLFRLGDPQPVERLRSELEAALDAGSGQAGAYTAVRLSYLHQRTGDLAGAEELQRRAVRGFGEMGMADVGLACILALRGKKAEALEWLQKGVRTGFDDTEWLERDRDLESLRAEPGFQALLAESRQRNRAQGPRPGDAEKPR